MSFLPPQDSIRAFPSHSPLPGLLRSPISFDSLAPARLTLAGPVYAGSTQAVPTAMCSPVADLLRQPAAGMLVPSSPARGPLLARSLLHIRYGFPQRPLCDLISASSKEGDFHFSGRCDLVRQCGPRRDGCRSWFCRGGIEGRFQGILDELGTMDLHRGERTER